MTKIFSPSQEQTSAAYVCEVASAETTCLLEQCPLDREDQSARRHIWLITHGGGGKTMICCFVATGPGQHLAC